jgi:hypothetical protein
MDTLRPKLAFERLNANGLTVGYEVRVSRAKVPGGWLIVVEQAGGEGLTFMPDPEHKWSGGSLP